MSKADTGSCLCGKITYKITGKIGAISHCHCNTCRKAHGAAFSSVASVKDSDFAVSGIALLKSFESSTGKKRYFCSHCGTQIYAKRDNTQHVILRLGSLDTAPITTENNHIWVSEKAHWYTINSNLPEHSEF
jgi:hypothetical protein